MNMGVSVSKPQILNGSSYQVKNVELLAQINSTLPFAQSLAILPEVVKALKQLESLEYTLESHRLLGFARHYSGPLVYTTNKDRNEWAEVLFQQGFVSFFICWYQVLFKSSLFGRKGESICRNFRLLLGTIWNVTEVNLNCCQEFCRLNGMKLLLEKLNSSDLKPEKLEQKDISNINRLYIAHANVFICRNVLLTDSTSKSFFRDANGIEILQKFLNCSIDIVKAKALLCLAYGLNEAECQSVLLASPKYIEYLINCLNDCLKWKDHVGRIYPFAAWELVDGLNRLAINNDNKSSLVESGILQTYRQILASPIDTVELEATIKGFWTLAFNQTIREKLRSTKEIVEALEQLQTHSDPKIVKAAKGALWVIMNDHNKLKPLKPTIKGHVMLSYQWNYKPLVIAVKETLKGAGIDVWMDIEQMTGSTLEAMAEAIEQSSVVVVCLSESYKNSPSCRTEAEYAYKLRKPIVPIQTQFKYVPDGWLGILIGTKLYFNVSSTDSATHNGPAIVNEVRKQMDSSQLQICTAQTVFNVVLQPKTDEQQLKVANWTNEHVMNWLKRHQLDSLMTNLNDFDGEILLGLQKLYSRAPTVYYANVRNDLKIDSLIDIIRFTNALESLN